MNKHTGFIAADFMSILSLSLLIFMNQPQERSVTHKIDALPNGTQLIKKLGQDYQLLSGQHWLPLLKGLDSSLLIRCDDKEKCFSLFNINHQKADQVILALPSERKKKIQRLYYDNCKDTICTDVTYSHTKNEVTFIQN